MIRSIIAITFFFLASVPSYAEDGYHTFAGVNLFEKVTLPACPNATSQKEFLSLVKESCLISWTTTGDYQFISPSVEGPYLESGIPVRSMFISLDEDGIPYNLQLHLDATLAKDVRELLKKRYGSTCDINMSGGCSLNGFRIAYDLKSFDAVNGEYSILLMIIKTDE